MVCFVFCSPTIWISSKCSTGVVLCIEVVMCCMCGTVLSGWCFIFILVLCDRFFSCIGVCCVHGFFGRSLVMEM